jgi:hypothetical protein
MGRVGECSVGTRSWHPAWDLFQRVGLWLGSGLGGSRTVRQGLEALVLDLELEWGHEHLGIVLRGERGFGKRVGLAREDRDVVLGERRA